MDKNARSVFEQCEALARLRASLRDEASRPAAEPTGRYLRRLYGAPIISDWKARDCALMARKGVAVNGRCKVRKGMPDRKGFPHPCGSAAPSLARTLCSSGIPFLPGRALSLL